MREERTEIYRHLLALTQIPGLGPRRIPALLSTFQQLADLFKAKKRDLEKIAGLGPQTAESILAFDGWKEIDRILEKASALPIDLLDILDEDYPPLLRQLADPPSLLWVWGDKTVLKQAGLAVIGTRNASSYAKEVTDSFTSQLVESGLVVFSGLAVGVDTMAHRKCVELGGKTVAVLGSGIDRLYPDQNKGLARKIAENGGAVISEFLPGTKPDAGNFPERNRIVSGLSLGTLVIETAVKGGSMITARLALDQNREVFVVPHALGNDRSSGNHWLIQNGLGKLVTNVADILDEIPNFRPKMETETEVEVSTAEVPDLEPNQKLLYSLLLDGEQHIDDLVEKSGFTISELHVLLLEMEFGGLVRQMSGKRFVLRKK